MHVSDWVAPVPGNICQAQCRWCQVELTANYKDLKQHLQSPKHVTEALMYNVVAKTAVSTQMSSVLGKESTQQGDSLISVITLNVNMVMFNVLMFDY